MRQGFSEPIFHGDLVYKLKTIFGSHNISAQFMKIISHYKKIDYNINVLQQTACLVVNTIMVDNFAFFFNCTAVGRNFEIIRGSLMKPNRQKLASLAQEICTLLFQFFDAVFASKGYPFQNIFRPHDGSYLKPYVLMRW